MPRASQDVAMTEAYLPQQRNQKQQQHPPREFLVKAELWYKNLNASRKVSTRMGIFSALWMIPRYHVCPPVHVVALYRARASAHVLDCLAVHLQTPIACFSQTISAKGRTKEKRQSYGPTPPPTAPPEDTSGFLNKLRERPSWMSKVVISASNTAALSSNASAGMWRPVICKLIEDGLHSTLSIYGEDNLLAHSVYVPRLTSTDIRTADRSLFFRHDVLGIHCTP
jgi:hypothetical protein